ncbi:flagellar hook-basal body protein FliE [Ventosimonas gracilis]|uniref:Flagellar hook-basal body complex protein FliE n=1 Tax=Ventosimonas gracilis TaxID=1680762 RepID=A0A139SWX2_9GAMM|nr:flagellar hook-basal body complex protein FliE [Ventosimonas gracilis]KXU38940.1 flagellar hook-basal body protein FliE [Ventosimonas gracilis]
MSQTIEASSLLSQMHALQNAASGAGAFAAPSEDARFTKLFGDMLDKASAQQQAAREIANAFEIGQSDTDLSDVMIAMQKANVSFAALTQVRNKLVQAYQDIMQMPI